MFTSRVLKAALVTCLTVFLAGVGGGAYAEEDSSVLDKAKKIKRLFKHELSPYSHIIGVLKTGQKVSYAPGDDGDLEKGVRWPKPRFLDHGDGTVTDQVTGLMWVKDTRQIPHSLEWRDAVKSCNDLEFAQHDNWRLPNVRELMSLIDFGASNPALPEGHPFVNVDPLDSYWSSTTVNPYDAQAWSVEIRSGSAHRNGKAGNLLRMWPVRRGSAGVW